MKVKRLDELDCGEKGRIVKIRGKADFHRRLFETELAVGRLVSIGRASTNLSGDPIEVKSNGRSFLLESDACANIQVEVI